MEDRIKLARPFLFYVFLFAGYASAFPFIVVYYQGLGFSGAEIGLLTGISPLITFLGAPFWTRLADSTRRHRLIMSLTMATGILAVCILPLLRTFAPILVTGMILSFFMAPASSFADNSTMHTLGDKKELYGRIRLGGTIGYALAAPLAGIFVQNTSLRAAFWLAGVMYLLAMLASQNFNHGTSVEKPAVAHSAGTLLRDPRWILFLGIAFAGGLSMAAANNYFFPLMKELGAKESLMGIALSVGTVLEFPVLFFGNRLIRYFKPYGLFMIAMVFTGVRLLLFGLNTSPDWIPLIQLLNGLSFPAMWMAGVAYAHERAPAGLTTTAQGMFSAVVFGIGSAAGGFLGGPLLEILGGRGLFLAYGGIVFAVIATGVLIGRLLPDDKPKATTALIP
ncbi:MAG: major facilitator superfamily domain-containing protein 6 [Anaerolineales bacterium]